VDASDSHVGGVLQQRCGRGWQSLAFYSKKLPSTEVRYSTFDRELLTAFLTIRHFRFLLEGRQFTLLTDHKPLVPSMTRVTPLQSARQQRHLAFVSEFTTDLRHTPVSDNVVADALSRTPTVVSVSAEGLPVLSIPPPSSPSEPPRRTASPVPAADAQPTDFLELSFAQPSCSDVQAMLVSPSLSVVTKKVGAADVLGDVSTGVFRPLLPVRRRVVPAQHPSSRCESFQASCLCQFLLAKNGCVCFRLGSELSPLPESKGPPPCLASGFTHSSPGSPFFTPTCGSGRPSSSLFRFCVSVHGD
jgi:hypothetical protein